MCLSKPMIALWKIPLVRKGLYTLNLWLNPIFCLFQESLNSNNYDKFVSLITGEVTSQLEKGVVKVTFNRVSF